VRVPTAHVRAHVVYSSKGHVTLGALVRPFAGVRARVFGEQRRRFECRLTRNAHVCAFDLVVHVTHMRAQRVHAYEGTGTLSAFIRSFVHVTTSVLLFEVSVEIVFRGKVQSAHGALCVH
jgi:hypothetical protein